MREVLTTLQRYSNLSVRSFSDAKSQPPVDRRAPSGGSRHAPVHSKESETVVASAMKTTPEAGLDVGLDTASPHAVSQDASPRSRKVVVLAGAAFASGLVAMIGWQLGHTRERACADFGRGGTGAPAASTANVVSAIATEIAPAPIPTPTPAPAAHAGRCSLRPPRIPRLLSLARTRLRLAQQPPQGQLRQSPIRLRARPRPIPQSSHAETSRRPD